MFESTSSPEARLERVEKLVTEMHSMMRADRRSRRIGTFFKLIYWGAFAYGMFYTYTHYLIPVIKQSSDALNQIQQMQQSVASSTNKINKDLNSVSGGVDISRMQEILKGLLPAPSPAASK